jgi:hypothetical protein
VTAYVPCLWKLASQLFFILLTADKSLLNKGIAHHFFLFHLEALGTAEMVADMVLGNPGIVDLAAFALQGRCC